MPSLPREKLILLIQVITLLNKFYVSVVTLSAKDGQRISRYQEFDISVSKLSVKDLKYQFMRINIKKK